MLSVVDVIVIVVDENVCEKPSERRFYSETRRKRCFAPSRNFRQVREREIPAAVINVSTLAYTPVPGARQRVRELRQLPALPANIVVPKRKFGG